MTDKSTGTKVLKGIFVVIFLLLIVFVGVIGLINYVSQSQFHASFDVDIALFSVDVTDEQRQIIQPLVSEKLKHLKRDVESIRTRKEDLLRNNDAIEPEEVESRLDNLRTLNTAITFFGQTYEGATKAARHYGFDTLEDEE